MNRKVFNVTAASGLLACMAVASLAFAADRDAQIVKEFNNSYVYKTYLKDDSVKIGAKNGVATLTGSVAEESHKSLAADLASGIPGVTDVDNQLEVKGESYAPASDAWISAKLKLALMFHGGVSYRKTTIDVKDGVVTLTGDADSAAQKELTGEYAKDIDGVKDVKNEIAVVPPAANETRTAGEKFDDASITAQIKLALLTHRSTSAIKTTVTTRKGVVTLTGSAKNDAEKALVTKLVNDINGVKSVTNNMSVEPQSK